VIGLLMLAAVWSPVAWLLGVGALGVAVSFLAARHREASPLVSLIALPSYLVVANLAGIAAWWETVRQKREAMWEPTRRDVAAADLSVGAR
jgi:hypothetical protein